MTEHERAKLARKIRRELGLELRWRKGRRDKAIRKLAKP